MIQEPDSNPPTWWTAAEKSGWATSASPCPCFDVARRVFEYSIDRKRVPARKSSRAHAAIETRHIPSSNMMTILRNKGAFLMVDSRIHAANCIATIPAPVDGEKRPRNAPRARMEPVRFVECSGPPKKPTPGAHPESASKRLRCRLHTAEHNRPRDQHEQHEQGHAPGGNGGDDGLFHRDRAPHILKDDVRLANVVKQPRRVEG